jgi:phosphatidylserine decarboxylase
MSVGHAPGEPQWTPDMRKDENQITEAEKAEAKRRIQGQVAEESPDDSGSGPDGEEGSSLRVPPVMASMAG